MLPSRWFLMLIILVFTACRTTPEKTVTTYRSISGKTMGTTYNITYAAKNNLDLKPKIDSILVAVNDELSTYIPTSLIAQINKEDMDRILQSETVDHSDFILNFEKAKEIYSLTNGSFDPTVMPIINYWGFGYDGRKKILAADSIKIDSLLQYVGFDKFTLRKKGAELFCSKSVNGSEIDFSALGKGYGVDKIQQFIESKGIINYMVEIGGELICRGKNASNQKWKIGINTPSENARLNDFKLIVQPDSFALATSGNYRNQYKNEKQTIHHTINPKTGYPERNDLLSASIITYDCMTADALATAVMTMGSENGIKLIRSLENTEALLIYRDGKGEDQIKYTEGFKKYIFDDQTIK